MCRGGSELQAVAIWPGGLQTGWGPWETALSGLDVSAVASGISHRLLWKELQLTGHLQLTIANTVAVRAVPANPTRWNRPTLTIPDASETAGSSTGRPGAS
jgi:hypothetical protein